MLQRPPVAAAARSETANRLASIGDGDVLVYDGDREVLPNTTDRFGSHLEVCRKEHGGGEHQWKGVDIAQP